MKMTVQEHKIHRLVEELQREKKAHQETRFILESAQSRIQQLESILPNERVRKIQELDSGMKNSSRMIEDLLEQRKEINESKTMRAQDLRAELIAKGEELRIVKGEKGETDLQLSICQLKLSCKTEEVKALEAESQKLTKRIRDMEVELDESYQANHELRVNKFDKSLVDTYRHHFDMKSSHLEFVLENLRETEAELRELKNMGSQETVFPISELLEQLESLKSEKMELEKKLKNNELKKK
ncbi:hypothetical protein CRE_01289 [Caenorhabditis remanei]|uniref:Uncharacterized protein n=1 Tax=Caenorhabditis remanei TaxID=31234 RepID=E3N9S7_CAERE|nr:hypothetical protein CRE_01289 [Caenorhabditis remanei]